jgi:outer membrane protein OmpA-like peptidoglycan-associated protein
MRVVPRLREPGEAPGPIRLHMPRPRSERARVATAPRAAERQAEAPRPAPAPARQAPVRQAPVRQATRAAAPPVPSASYGAGPGAAGLFGSLPSTTPARPQAESQANAQLASAAPPSAPAGTEGLNKQGVILFGHDADAPADTAIDAIRLLAAQLNNALTRPSSRIELMAYGGNKGDKGSDARRLSLKRALSIRQVLIDAGVNSARIDVHAQGGVDDTGPADRVDVYIKA